MLKFVDIGGRQVGMRASALIPRLYRYQFSRDLIADMDQLQKSYKKAQEGGNFDAVDLTIFENIAYLMVKQGGNEVPPTPDEWLDSIDGVFDIYKIMPIILELWNLNMATTSTPAKK